VATFVTASPAAILARTKKDADPDYRQVAWLGAKTDSALVLSAASFLQSRAFAPSRATQSFLAFADPSTPAKSDRQAYASVVKRGASRGVSLRATADVTDVCENTRLALLEMPALPDTADEVRQVGMSLGGSGQGQTIVTGKAFTDDTVKDRKDLSDYKVIYFATHGLCRSPRPACRSRR
jgi:CHAT domain-containing protein